MNKKFKAPSGTIRIALLNGQAVTLTTKARELPECFWSQAYALGAISGDMEKTSADEKAKQAKKEKDSFLKKEEKELNDFLLKIFDNPESYLDKDNIPITRKISATLGRTISRPTVLRLWGTIAQTEG